MTVATTTNPPTPQQAAERDALTAARDKAAPRLREALINLVNHVVTQHHVPGSDGPVKAACDLLAETEGI
jgi:hypothetical protein